MNSAWPAADLEHLGRCPVCGSESRSVRFTGLRDKAFGAASGEWTMYDCGGCGAAYLDPRPDEASIGRAYARYYTHDDDVADQPYLCCRHTGWKDRLKTGYLNGEYGYRFAHANALGHRLVALHGRLRSTVDFLIRHLPVPIGPDAKLLDIGCGSGNFLPIAEVLGYRAVGLDPDEKAIAAGRRIGLDIRQGLLPNVSFTESGFEQITLNHVLEHLHKPAEALRQALDLLVPGGRIWLSQPNLGALGLERFGENWRGLEAPRHLALFTVESLSALLSSIGFSDVRLLPAGNVATFYYRQSVAMSEDLDPYAEAEPKGWTRGLKAEANAADRAARRDAAVGESLTMTARRPVS